MPKKQILVQPEGHAKAGTPTGVIQFTFEDNTLQDIDVRKIPGMEFVSDVEAFVASTAGRALIHGTSQKIGDSYAGSKAEENPLAFAKQAAQDTIEQVLKGEWRAVREGGPRVTDLAVAFKRVSDAQGQEITLEAAVAHLGTLTDEETKVFRKKPKIAAALAQIAAEKAIERARKAQEAADKAA